MSERTTKERQVSLPRLNDGAQVFGVTGVCVAVPGGVLNWRP